jgi:two-component system sensor histidine kinase DctS
MGMGLAICRSILEAHHGRIELLDDRLHGGACFRFWIPVNE